MSSDEEDLDINDDTTSQLENMTEDGGDGMDMEDTTPSVRNSPAPEAPALTADNTRHLDLLIDPQLLTCTSYDCVPLAAAFHPSPIFSLAATRCFRWILTGSDDGYIRKWDFFSTMNGKTALTQALRHYHVDSVIYAGVISSWWENEEFPVEVANDSSSNNISNNDNNITQSALTTANSSTTTTSSVLSASNTTISSVPLPSTVVPAPTTSTSNRSLSDQKLSPVYSLDIHSEALWAVQGCENGSINLTTVRHDEGKTHFILRKHTAPVSVLKITPDETGLISGSWDKLVLEWDLNTGAIVRSYDNKATTTTNGNSTAPASHNSQISSAEFRPIYTPYLSQSESTADNSNKDTKDSKDNTDQTKTTTEETSAGLEWDRKDSNTLMTTSIDGQCLIWDRREPSHQARSLPIPQKTPPWCLSACWSSDGTKIYIGRRNGTVDEYDFAQQKQIQSLRMPANSGPVSCVRSMPNGKHIICASNDNIRLWNTTVESTFTIRPNTEGGFINAKASTAKLASVIPFNILPGHHGGTISHIAIDPTCKYMITTSGNRGWEGASTNACLFYDISSVM
ncbi:WD40-repeat-containing domain protein [Mycotypha africana]|uniref:WD40-repeat-containing domain protein n=1 Tax=Mycotypha africana TaxID=64632 RepID=UPI0022FFFF0F|nr:WD40-repeat-containing domain protein [Mycotypha africana]KAI8991348.1 WD40-repeat-containing domain protein [Mycotypha africana]